MDTPLLIDAIVRQTMVLIAQLSTANGRRSPLSHVADRVFLDLVAELERQRLGKKVIADMFGLALRSYQQKVQRLGESATDGGQTLWSAVMHYLRERSVTTKADVLRRFSRDDEGSVRGILTDLVENGLVFQSGKGDAAIYRVTSEDDWGKAEVNGEGRALAAWLLLYREGTMRAEQIAERLRLETGAAASLLEPLLSDGRVRIELLEGVPHYATTSCVIALGEPSGFEAGIIDHFRAVSSALSAKVKSGARSSSKDDATGGSTFTFELEPGHALESEIRGTLGRLRQELIALWDRVAAENARKPLGESSYRVTTYVGQFVETEEST